MSFLHEHTWAGEAGYLLVIIAFVASLSAITGYTIATRQNPLHTTVWLSFSRFFFFLHSVAVAATAGLLFWMIANHYFEYHYVWKYSSLSMEAKYIFSCFWSGQEGSFLLWAFWIVVLSWFVIGKSGTWEAPVMIFVLAVQAFIISMLLGVYVGDFRIGSSPFILIRQLPENVNMPWARMSDYLERITSFGDGVGLNPLLQNYWMTIHPPVLFLGFAATVFPFAFSMAAVTSRQYSAWLKPAVTWMIFAVAVLGAGILLGGAWAYESLSFGGFWAWDPVENASLVPWLLAVTGLHFIHVADKRQRGIFTSLLFAAAPLVFVVYSSFLTRSGILGESSVHSFTENGLFIQLLTFLFVAAAGTVVVLLVSARLRVLYLIVCSGNLLTWILTGSLLYSIVPWILLSVAFLLYAYEHVFQHRSKSEDPLHYSSREFWMLAGGLVIVMSALQITLTTSIPVINRLLGTRLDAFTELASRNVFYHTWQIPLAVAVCLLIGFTQYMQYRKTDLSIFLSKVKKTFLITLIAAVAVVLVLGYHLLHDLNYIALLFAATLAIVFNADFAMRLVKLKVNNAGSALAHVGFALLLLGALVSGSKKDVISKSTASFNLSELNSSFRNDENILLRHGDTLLMRDFFVHYRGKKLQNGRLFYEIMYLNPEWERESNALVPGDSAFTLYPQVQLNEQFGNVSEPGTKHFLTKDVFTHIKYADMQAFDPGTADGFMTETNVHLHLGAEAKMENYSFTFTDIFLVDEAEEKRRAGFLPDDLVVKAVLKVRNTERKEDEFRIEPLFVVRDSVTVIPHEVYSESLDARIRIAEIPREPDSIVLGIRQREFIVMQAYIFPAMNLLWSGCILMITGCFVALRQRRRLAGGVKR